MVRILRITFDPKIKVYYATTPNGKIIYGGLANAGSINGKSLQAIMKAAIEYADVISADLLEVVKNE